MQNSRESLLLGALGVALTGLGLLFVLGGPQARLELALLTGTFAVGAVVIRWHYRKVLTGRLIAASLALGAVILLLAAAVQGGATWLVGRGWLPQLPDSVRYPMISLWGAGAAVVAWNSARGRSLDRGNRVEEVAPAGPLEAHGEPAPPPDPTLEAAPDWDHLASELDHESQREQLAVLRRIHQSLPAGGGLAATRRILHQEALRLAQEAEARRRERAEGDGLSQAARFFDWGLQKLPELAELDLSDLLMAKAVADIRTQHDRVERRFVDHRSLRAIHPIDRDTAVEKCEERAEAARAALPLLRANGMRLSEELIASHEELAAFRSVTGFQVVELEAGFVTFEGNGRREALQRAFGDEEGVQIEVRHFQFDDPQTDAAIRRRVQRVRDWKEVRD